MRALLIISVIALTISFKLNAVAHDKPIVVAVIDTGINPELKDKVQLCKQGHKDFTGTGIEDTHGHGSHISGLIDANVKGVKVSEVDQIKANYCQVIIKFFDSHMSGNALDTEVKALRWAIDLKVNVINFSGGGHYESREERLLIKEALDKGIKVIVAAGNDHHELAGDYKFYPAMTDKRLYVVGNLDSNRVPASSSNFGALVNTWEFGTKMQSFCKFGSEPICYLTGTSQATDISR